MKNFIDALAYIALGVLSMSIILTLLKQPTIFTLLGGI